MLVFGLSRWDENLPFLSDWLYDGRWNLYLGRADPFLVKNLKCFEPLRMSLIVNSFLLLSIRKYYGHLSKYYRFHRILFIRERRQNNAHTRISCFKNQERLKQTRSRLIRISGTLWFELLRIRRWTHISPPGGTLASVFLFRNTLLHEPRKGRTLVE